MELWGVVRDVKRGSGFLWPRRRCLELVSCRIVGLGFGGLAFGSRLLC